MATYRVELRDLFSAGHAVRTSSVGFAEFSYTTVLNGPGAFEGTIALTNVPANFTPGNRELLVYRDSTQVWGGYLSYVEVDRESRLMRVGGEGYWSAVRRRVVRGNATFSSTTAHAIAWNLLSNSTGTQGATNGDLGIRQGTHTGTSASIANRYYCGADAPNIADIVEEFADAGRLDFEATPAQASGRAALFNTWKERGTDRSGTLTLNGSNTMTLNYTITAADLATRVYVYSNADCPLPWEPLTATANTATYGVNDETLDVHGRDQTHAQAKADEYLRAYKAPRWSADVTYMDGVGPALSAYDLGDYLGVTPADGYTTGTKSLRVSERSVAVGPEGAVVSLILEERPV